MDIVGLEFVESTDEYGNGSLNLLSIEEPGISKVLKLLLNPLEATPP